MARRPVFAKASDRCRNVALAHTTTQSAAEMLRRTLQLGRVKLPGRKSLDDVCKLELLQAAKPEEVMNIWLGHHAQFSQYWGRVMSSAAYNAMRPRLEASRYFVVPLFRDKGIYNAVTNFNADIVGVTPLQEWQNKGDHAQVHMLVQFFTELSASKNLVLVRCELQDKHMTRQDCALVTSLMMRFYTDPRLYETYVETFNKRPHNFDYHAYLRCIKDAVGGKAADSVKIEDKKLGHARSAVYTTATPNQAAPVTDAGISLPTATQKEALQRSFDKAKLRNT